MEYLGINIDLSRDLLFDELGLRRLKESYMRKDEDSPQHRYAYVAKALGSDQEHAQRLYDYSSKHWLSWSTPNMSYGKSRKALTLSCYLSYIPDTSEGLIDALAEINTLSMLGGGVGIGCGMRSSDNKSVGVMPHLKVYDASTLAYKQETRRGSYAAFLPIHHPDVMMFLDMRKPTGDQNTKCLNMHHGIMISDKFMQIIEKCMIEPNYDDSWKLYDDHAPDVVKDVVSAKELWQRILELRMQTGEPYIQYIDTANRILPDFQKKLGLSVKQGNICVEINEPTDENRTATCCLSSVNLRYYDNWKDDYQFFKDIAEALDNSLQLFIDNAPKAVQRAVFSSEQSRAIGIGALGFHTYLQQNNIPFDSVIAKSWNKRIFKNFKQHIDRANVELGKERGSCPDYINGSDNLSFKRFSVASAIAPNASSSIILGNISPSIEPIRANAYRQDTISGSFLNKNFVLDNIIKDMCANDGSLDYDAIWLDIISNDGSIQHMDIFNQDTKDVFKTAMELDQRWIIELAGDRQPELDQTQSVNLFFRPDADIKYIHAVHYMAWKHGLPTLYYCRSDSFKKADKVSNSISRNIIDEIDLSAMVYGEDCIACQ